MMYLRSLYIEIKHDFCLENVLLKTSDDICVEEMHIIINKKYCVIVLFPVSPLLYFFFHKIYVFIWVWRCGSLCVCSSSNAYYNALDVQIYSVHTFILLLLFFLLKRATVSWIIIFVWRKKFEILKRTGQKL